MAPSVSFFAIEIFAASTFSAIFKMSLALLFTGIAGRSSGVAFSASATNLYSASASLNFPLPASAIPRAKCQNTVVIWNDLSGCFIAMIESHL